MPSTYTIQQALDELERQDDVAAYLVSQGIELVRMVPPQKLSRNCPIARFISFRTGLVVSGYCDGFGERQSNDEGWRITVQTGSKVRDFILAFDSWHYEQPGKPFAYSPASL